MSGRNLLPFKHITKIRFSIAGDDDNELDSYASIRSSDMFKGTIPYSGGIYDKSLGTTDYSYSCDTCANTKDACIGHEGHRRLSYPVKQPIFEADIIKWLNIICFKCGKAVISDEKIKSLDNGDNLLRTVYNFVKSSSRKCHWCVLLSKRTAMGSAQQAGTMSKADPTEYVEIIDGKKVTFAVDKKAKKTSVAKSTADSSLNGDDNLTVTGDAVDTPLFHLTNKAIHIGFENKYLGSGGALAHSSGAINITQDLHPQVRHDRRNPYTYHAMYMDKTQIMYEENLYPHHIKEIFSRISDDTVRLLGRSPSSHPRKLIVSVIRVPPSAIRPDTRRLSGARVSKINEISTGIQCIIKKDSKIPKGFIADDPKFLQNIEKLNEYYHELVKGPMPSAHKAGSRLNTPSQNKSLGTSLVGKHGMIRKHQLGKRVHKMLRSTITCNPRLAVDQVAVPISFARNVQKVEVLQPYNKDRLMMYVNNGRKRYPGCTMVKKVGIADPYSIETIDENFVFEYGDEIYRDFVTDDIFDFNRQPSLNFSSIGGHRMVINENLSENALEFNVISCSWYNADFDGDQMGCILPTTEMTEHEAAEMGGVKNWFISYKNSATTIGQADDSLIGTYELTRDNVKFDKYHALLLFENTSHLPSFDDKIYSGRDIMSKILERTPINYNKRSGCYKSEYAPYLAYSPTEVNIKIRNGVMESGTLTKKEIGQGGTGGLFHKIHIDHGPEETLMQIHNVQQVAIGYLYQYGFTIGIDDMVLTREALSRVRQIETNMIHESELITDKLNRGEIIPPIGKTTDQFYEEQQRNNLRVLDDFIEPVLSSIDPNTNNLLKLILSGSKGKINNLFAIIGAIGQIIINGERIDKRFGYERTIPYFQRFATTPGSRGFIANSYMSGMTLPEFIFNSYNARFDIISKALSTSITGEKNRESIKALESIVIDNFRICRKDYACVQMAYGEDNIDTRRLIKVKLPHTFISNEEFESQFKCRLGKSAGHVKHFDEEFALLKKDREEFRLAFLSIENRSFKELTTDEKFLPVDIQKIYDDVLVIYDEQTPSIDDIIAMMDRVRDFVSRVPYFLMNDMQEKRRIKLLSYQVKSVRLFVTLIRVVLCANALSKINTDILTHILTEVKTRFKLALVSPGTAKGIIAAQSFSEPLTQYMLDAHKRSAEGGTSKDDVIKLREVLGAKSLEKSAQPKMLIRLHEKYQHDKERVQEVANNIEMMSIDQFVVFTAIFIETIHKIRHPDFRYEKALIDEFLSMNPLKTIPDDLTNVCIRLQLDKTKLILKNMPLELIVMRLSEEFKHIYIVYSAENSPEIILRIYLRNGAFKGVMNEKEILDIKNEIMKMTIRGTEGIINAKLVPLIRNEIKPDGSIGRLKDGWAIQTRGSNIYGVAQNKYVDTRRIIADSADETLNMYGIMTAKHRVVSELRNIGDGLTLSHHHFTLYASEMTYTGVITPISNTGVATRDPHNILLRMGTSAPIQVLEQAALKASVNKITGNTAPLMIGSVPQIGTLYNSFHIDEKFVQKNTPRLSQIIDDL